MGASVSTAVQVGSVRSSTGLSWSKGEEALSAAVTCGDVTFDVTAEGESKTVSLQLESSCTTIKFSMDSIKGAAAGQATLRQSCNAMQLKEKEVVLKEVPEAEFTADKLASLPEEQQAVAITKLVEEPWSAVPDIKGMESRLVMVLKLQVVVCKGTKARGVSEGVVQTSLKLSGTVQQCVEVRSSNNPPGATSSAQASAVEGSNEENFMVALSQAVFPMAGAALGHLLGKKGS